MPLTRFFKFGRKDKGTPAKGNPLDGIDEETLDVARNLVFEKNLRKATNAKWKRGKYGGSEDDDLTEVLKGLAPDKADIMKRVFARTVEDTVLANRFKTKEGKTVGHLTVKKAVAMDGLRDLDDDVGVSPSAATPMNPEGRFNFPVGTNGGHEFSERFNEAMNPVRSGRFNSVVPAMIMDHFANYSAFIGYPLCEVIACHPTVSNACTIPGEDAIAPGYALSFVDSEDMNGNGIPDDLETAEMGGVKRALGRIGAMEALKDAIVTLSKGEAGVGHAVDSGANLDALVLALERLSAYEAWERDMGEGEDAAQAVNEGFIQPISSAFSKFSANPSDENRKSAYHAVSLAFADLANAEHPSLVAVRATQNRRGTVEAVGVAYETLTKPEVDFDVQNALNALAVAVERVGAYEKLSDRNAEAKEALNAALIDLSSRQDADAHSKAATTLGKIKAAMDADDFDFGMPQASYPLHNQEKDAFDLKKAERLEQERQEDRRNRAERRDRSDKAREGRIDQLHQQKMGIIQKEADQRLRQQQEQFEAQRQQESDALRQEAAQQAAEEASRREEDEKREKTRVAAEVAKERQKYLDRWKQRADDAGLNDICTKLARNARVFGIGIAVPLVDGVDYEQPMDFEKVKEGSYRGFTVIDPTWIYPEVDSDDLINPLSGSFFEPKYWAVTGSSEIGSLGVRRIHMSWMVIVRNKELPNMLRPMYYFGGIPLPQEIYEAVFCADKLMNEVPKLAMTKRSIIVKGEPTDLITNPEGVVERLTAMSQVQDSFGFKFVGRNTDVVQLETSLSEFDQCIAKANQRVAAIAKMPETKLFKTQLAGMNSAGRYEWDDYSQLLITIQNNWFKPLLSLHYKLDTKSRTGKVIDLKVTFNPIDVPTQAEKGEAESRTVQTLNSAVQGGWLSADEARTIARSREDSMFSSISAEMPEELSQQNQQQTMPMVGGMQGMPDLTGGIQPTGGGGEPMPPKEPDKPKDIEALKEQKDLEEPKMPKENMSAPSVRKVL